VTLFRTRSFVVILQYLLLFILIYGAIILKTFGKQSQMFDFEN